MRKAEFNVLSNVMVPFATELVARDLINSIISVENDVITIEVEFDKEQAAEVDELEDILDDLIDEEEEEDEK
jgi:hypothetical protein